MNLIDEYIISLSSLYGLVHKEKVVEIYNMQNENEITLSHLELIMENNEDMLESHFVYVEGNYFVHETIIAFDEFDLYITQKMGKPYYIPDKKELLKYKDQFYFEKPKEYWILVDYITRELVENDKQRAEEVSEDIQGLCQSEASPVVVLENISRLIEFKDEKQISELMNLIMNLSNNTRIWANNGYTPNELFDNHEKKHLQPLPKDDGILFSQEGTYHKEQKIGRNDLCPCGSEKKYKKCCL